MPLTGIHNENEFYSHHYLAEIFAGAIQATIERWREQADAANARTPWAELRALAPEYLRFRGDFNRERRSGQRTLRQREWFRALLGALGHCCQPANLVLGDNAEVPILCADSGPAHAPRLLALGAFDATSEGEDPLSLKPHWLQFHGEAPPLEAVLNETWETIVTRRLFAHRRNLLRNAQRLPGPSTGGAGARLRGRCVLPLAFIDSIRHLCSWVSWQ